MTTSVPINIRPAKDTDLGLVVSTWVGSHRSAMRWIPKADHDRLYRPAVKQAIERSTVLVACDMGDEDHVYGWVCMEPDGLLHYVFTKSKFRNLGIARRLMERLYTPAVATAWTPDGQFLERANLTARYRPDLFPHGGTK